MHVLRMVQVFLPVFYAAGKDVERGAMERSDICALYAMPPDVLNATAEVQDGALYGTAVSPRAQALVDNFLSQLQLNCSIVSLPA